MRILICSDVHANYEPLYWIVEATNPDLILCCGDVTGVIKNDKELIHDLPVLDVPFYFIPGNHENLALKALDEKRTPQRIAHNVWYIPRPCRFTTKGVTCIGLGGNFAPSDYERDVQRKWHYSAAMFEEASSFDSPDILLTHESPATITTHKRVIYPRPEVRNLVKVLQPKVSFFGHHHVFYAGKVQKKRVFGVPMPRSGCYTLEDDCVTKWVRARGKYLPTKLICTPSLTKGCERK